MRRLLPTLAAAALFLPGSVFSHGGTYRGPGDTVPPGGRPGGGGNPGSPGSGTPTSPGTGIPTSPSPGGGMPGSVGGSPGGGPSRPVTGGGGSSPDLTSWTFWWEFNKDPYLQLKAHVFADLPVSEGSGVNIGRTSRRIRAPRLAPSRAQIRDEIVPALLHALETESNPHVLTGALIALARIGDERREDGSSDFAESFEPFLESPSVEVSETAALALGILGHAAVLPRLEALVLDTGLGRELTGSGQVPARTAAFAAYGIGLVGKRGDDATKAAAVRLLIEAFETDRSALRDGRVACLVSLGLVPVVPLGRTDEPDADAPVESLANQIAWTLRLLDDPELTSVIRAHAPTTAARLAGALPDADPLRARVVEALVQRVDPRSQEDDSVVGSCVIAMGILADDDGDPLDVRMRKALERASKDGNAMTRRFALIALAQACGRRGTGEDVAFDAVARRLVTVLASGRSGLDEWGGLALGVLVHALHEGDSSRPVSDLVAALRRAHLDASSPDERQAYAIALGLARDIEGQAQLITSLERERDPVTRGYTALALGLLGDPAALEPIRALVASSQRKPELLRQAAIALGILGDKSLVPELIGMLEEAKPLSSQAALATALGFIGDTRSVPALVRLLQEGRTGMARGFAAAALGRVGDAAPLPWNAAFAVDLNYRASVPTLNEPAQGSGLLNLL